MCQRGDAAHYPMRSHAGSRQQRSDKSRNSEPTTETTFQPGQCQIYPSPSKAAGDTIATSVSSRISSHIRHPQRRQPSKNTENFCTKANLWVISQMPMDLRILIVALPILLALSWAAFNIGRAAISQLKVAINQYKINQAS